MPKKQAKYIVNGEPVPGVTTVLSVIAKPGLMMWYGKHGNQKCREISNEAKIFGDKLHAVLEQRINGQQLQLDQKFTTIIANFDLVTPGWKWLGTETVVLNEQHMYGGTYDALAEVEGVKTLVDFKTSSDGRAWPEHQLQVSAYMACLSGITQARILYLNKETLGWSVVNVAQSDVLFNTFLAAKTIYDWQHN
jgi:hypothetical protein